MLVNLQPRGDSIGLDVRLGSEHRPKVGLVFDDAEAQEDMKSSHRTLTALAAEGLFTRCDEGIYLLEFHFSSPEDWHEFLVRPKAGGVEADSDLLSAALAHPDGRIVATESTTITTYKRSC